MNSWDGLTENDLNWSDVSIERKSSSTKSISDRLPVPVTIRDLSKHDFSVSNMYSLGMYNFSTVIVVGIINWIERKDGMCKYTLYDPEDQDCQYEVFTFNCDEDNNFIDSSVDDGVRVRCIGKLGNFEKQTSILAYHISRMCNDQDYTIFKLETRASQLFFEKNVIERIRCGQTFSGMLAPPLTKNIEYHAISDDKQADLKIKNVQQRKIVNFFKKFPCADGYSFKSLRGAIGQPPTNIMHELLNELIEQGILYTNSDDYYCYCGDNLY